MRVDNLPFLACVQAQSGRLSTLVILVSKNPRSFGARGTLFVECGCRRLLRDGDGDLGVAGAGALGAGFNAEGEHEAVTGLRVGGYGERGVRRAFLP